LQPFSQGFPKSTPLFSELANAIILRSVLWLLNVPAGHHVLPARYPTQNPNVATIPLNVQGSTCCGKRRPLFDTDKKERQASTQEKPITTPAKRVLPVHPPE